jgi:hypothetical protein
MTLKTMARFNTYDKMVSGYIGARKVKLGLWSRSEEETEQMTQ